MTLLAWLEEWYQQQCNGHWEDWHGIKIETRGSPYWNVEINVAGTSLENKKFELIDQRKRSDNGWIYCTKRENSFHANGGEFNVIELVTVFKTWASDSLTTNENYYKGINLLEELSQWHCEQCDGHWEQLYHIEIITTANPGWLITIPIIGTPLENKSFKPLSVTRSKTDFVHYRVKDGKFQGFGGIKNLEELLFYFCEWRKQFQEKKKSELTWLQSWYKWHCGDFWEQHYGIDITTSKNCSWKVQINVQYIELEKRDFQSIHSKRSEHDWITCWVQSSVFHGRCSSNNLVELFTIFKKWAIQYKTYDHNNFHYQQYEQWFQEISYRKDGKQLNLKGRVEYNKVTKSDIYSPYVHEDKTPGRVRTATQEEIEKGI